MNDWTARTIVVGTDNLSIADNGLQPLLAHLWPGVAASGWADYVLLGGAGPAGFAFLPPLMSAFPDVRFIGGFGVGASPFHLTVSPYDPSGHKRLGEHIAGMAALTGTPIVHLACEAFMGTWMETGDLDCDKFFAMIAENLPDGVTIIPYAVTTLYFSGPRRDFTEKAVAAMVKHLSGRIWPIINGYVGGRTQRDWEGKLTQRAIDARYQQRRNRELMPGQKHISMVYFRSEVFSRQTPSLSDLFTYRMERHANLRPRAYEDTMILYTGRNEFSAAITEMDAYLRDLPAIEAIELAIDFG